MARFFALPNRVYKGKKFKALCDCVWRNYSRWI